MWQIYISLALRHLTRIALSIRSLSKCLWPYFLKSHSIWPVSKNVDTNWVGSSPEYEHSLKSCKEHLCTVNECYSEQMLYIFLLVPGSFWTKPIVIAKLQSIEMLYLKETYVTLPLTYSLAGAKLRPLGLKNWYKTSMRYLVIGAIPAYNKYHLCFTRVL